jgi:hypothetical protein
VLSQVDGTAGSGTSASSAASSTTSSQTGTSTTADGTKLKAKVDEAIATGFIAPMLADAMGQLEQRYFSNSPAEQTFANQLYTEIATRIGQSGKLPLGKQISQALLQRLANSSSQGSASSSQSSASGSQGSATSSQGSAGTSTSGNGTLQ